MIQDKEVKALENQPIEREVNQLAGLKEREMASKDEDDGEGADDKKSEKSTGKKRTGNGIGKDSGKGAKGKANK
jgi:hypothetical protein